MPVRTAINHEDDITEHTATGVIIDEEMFGAQTEFYENGPTRLQLWDMTDCSVTEVTIGGMRSFIAKAAELGRSRTNGRTAVIVNSDLQYGLGRMAEMFAEFVSIPFAFRIFKSRTDALAWLNSESKDENE